MASKTTTEEGDVRLFVRAGERAVLLSHDEYRRARAEGRGVEDYDVLMRRPDDEPGAGELSEAARWISVPAAKYLKHRAIGWREAESADELPADWRELAAERESFPVEAPSEEGAE
ncbi:MAG: hypothetical protein OXI41_14575 [Chloroflexota bacterium]|nr:hypothetical protein [Chloroflexota bacterium]MDE2895799.1 hypothetical protein [Chloroflexota bacterium]